MWYYARRGEQVGPISEAELKGLIASDQLSDSTLAWTDGMPAWAPISAISALAKTANVSLPPSDQAPSAAPAEEPVNPYAAPTFDMEQPIPGQSAMDGLEEIIPGSQPINIGGCISRAFELTKQHFGQILLIGIVMILISIAVSFVLDQVDQLLGLPDFGSWSLSNSRNFQVSIGSFDGEGSLLNQIITGLLNIFLELGTIRIGLNIISGKEFSIGMLFSQGNRVLRTFIAEILYGLMVVIGLVLLIFPGIYLALRYSQYKHAIVDKGMGIFDAFSYSARLTENNKLPLAGLFLLLILIIIGGVIALIVGLAFAIPLVTLAWMVAYRWMQYGYSCCQNRIN